VRPEIGAKIFKEKARLTVVQYLHLRFENTNDSRQIGDDH